MRESSHIYLLILTVASASLQQSLAAITEEDVVAYNSWESWTFTERLSFLLFDEDWYNLRSEFGGLDPTGSNDVSLSDFVRVFEDFNDEETIEDFYNACVEADDPANEASSPNRCDFFSYAISRGSYDANGTPVDANEWEMRESMFLTGYQDRMRSQDITEDELELLGLRVNEDGILIDNEF